jgi:formylglycine-generating enzyme required for sulfatase activity
MGRRAAVWGIVAALGVVGALLIGRAPRDRVTCGPGFEATGPRCLRSSPCPPPLATVGGQCEASARVLVPKTRLVVGPADWEAEGNVAPRTIEEGPFWIDAFEATIAAFTGRPAPDGLRAASGMTRGEAASYCEKRGGYLPSEDQWMVAAAGPGGHRYPWGETGAVCRRAAFGLAVGPCASTATGADTVGAHIDGDTASGAHDLAGNVAEWVAASPDKPRVGVAKGGSWRTELATGLRVWAKLELAPEAHDDRVGVRCAYPAP